MAIEIAVSLALCVFSLIHSPRLSRSLSTSAFRPSRMIATCCACSALVTLMLAILQQNYATEKQNYFNTPPVCFFEGHNQDELSRDVRDLEPTAIRVFF